MKVFITGANGGLGLALCQMGVDLGFEIIANGRSQNANKKITQMACEYISGDIKYHDFTPNFSDIDYIIHAAAISSPWGKKKEFTETNEIGTQKIINFAKKAKVKGLVFISSPSVFAREKNQYNIKENEEVAQKPLNYYAESKIAAEKIVLNNNSQDFKTIIIRPRAIICEDDKVLLPRFLKLIKKGKFPLFNNGSAHIEPTDARDVAHAVFLAIEKISILNGEVFNISGGKAKELKQMVFELSKNMETPVKFIEINYNFARFFVKIIEQICKILPNYPEPLLTNYSLAALSFSQTFDLEKAKNKLGFKPRYDAFETANQIAKNINKKAING